MDEKINPYDASQTPLSDIDLKSVKSSGLAYLAWTFFIVGFIIFFAIDYQLLS